MVDAFAEIAFTPAVSSQQKRMGSADRYAGFLARDTETVSSLAWPSLGLW